MKHVITRFTCDICNSTIDHMRGTWYFTGGKVVKIKHGVLSKWESVDLCNDCFENLSKWLKSKKREREVTK